MKDPRYPDARVRLIGEDGNIGSIMGRVTTALRRQAGVSHAVCDEFRMQVLNCASYDEALQTVMAWVTVEDFEDDDGCTGAESALLQRVEDLEMENAELRRRLAGD